MTLRRNRRIFYYFRTVKRFTAERQAAENRMLY